MQAELLTTESSSRFLFKPNDLSKILLFANYCPGEKRRSFSAFDRLCISRSFRFVRDKKCHSDGSRQRRLFSNSLRLMASLQRRDAQTFHSSIE
jgi:hypothetical protein